MIEPRTPAVSEPARELIPIANPAIATELVSCSVLKKIARPIMPYEIRAGRAAKINTHAFGNLSNSLYLCISCDSIHPH